MAQSLTHLKPGLKTRGKPTPWGEHQSLAHSQQEIRVDDQQIPIPGALQ